MGKISEEISMNPEDVSKKLADDCTLTSEGHLVQLMVADPSLAERARTDGAADLFWVEDSTSSIGVVIMDVLSPLVPGSKFWSRYDQEARAIIFKTLTPNESTPTLEEARLQYPGVILALKIQSAKNTIAAFTETLKQSNSVHDKARLINFISEKKRELTVLEHEQRCR